MTATLGKATGRRLKVGNGVAYYFLVAKHSASISILAERGTLHSKRLFAAQGLGYQIDSIRSTTGDEHLAGTDTVSRRKEHL